MILGVFRYQWIVSLGALSCVGLSFAWGKSGAQETSLCPWWPCRQISSASYSRAEGSSNLSSPPYPSGQKVNCVAGQGWVALQCTLPSSSRYLIQTSAASCCHLLTPTPVDGTALCGLLAWPYRTHPHMKCACMLNGPFLSV